MFYFHPHDRTQVPSSQVVRLRFCRAATWAPVSAASLGGMLPLLVARLGEAILGMVAPSLDLKIDQNGALPLSRSVYYSRIWEKIFEDRLPAAVPRLRCEEY